MIRSVPISQVPPRRRQGSIITSRPKLLVLQDAKELADPFHYRDRGLDIGGSRRPHFVAKRYPHVVAHHSHNYLVQAWPTVNVKKAESRLRRFVIVIVTLLDQLISDRSIILSQQCG